MVKSTVKIDQSAKLNLSNKKILFLGHEASLSGAPKLLLSLIQYLKENGGCEVMIFLKKGGPLLDEFKKLGEVHINQWPENKPSALLRFLIRFFPAYKVRSYLLKKSLTQFQPDLIVNYTIVNSRLFDPIESLKVPMLTVVQEMEYVIRLFDELGMNDSKRVIDRSSEFITCSTATKANLVANHDVPDDKVEVVYNSVAYHEVDKNSDQGDWRKNINIPSDAFVVGACGGPTWRKGADLFLKTAKAMKVIAPAQNIYFVWQGGNTKSVDYIDFVTEIKLLEIEDKVRIIPSVSDVSPFFEGIDVFTCTSREEPFGMVIMEAGLHQKPVIAFEKSGGPEEILADNRGVIVDYGDTTMMAKKILQLKIEKELYEELASNILEYAEANASKDNNGKIGEIVQRLIK